MKNLIVTLMTACSFMACGNSQQASNNSESTQTTSEVKASFADGVLTVNDLRYEFAKVDAGKFTMGIPEDEVGFQNITAEHEVTLTKNYFMGKTEVTQALWKAVMGSNPSFTEGDKLPVSYVSWNDCQTFISKLNAATGKTFRLPTEAEWEFAARGGNGSKNFKHAGSDNLDEVAWYADNSESASHEVAMKKPNELGLYDMDGNVAEWCNDWAGSDVVVGDQTDPQGPSEGYSRVVRGHCWGDVASNFGMCRQIWSPEEGSPTIGLRLCITE